jgi:acyl carrier protein
VTKKEFHLQLDELLELDPGTIQGNEDLAALPRWDSLAVMGLIAVLDRNFGIRASGERITSCRNIADLVALTEGRVSG